MTHQTLSLGKYWKQFSATLTSHAFPVGILMFTLRKIYIFKNSLKALCTSVTLQSINTCFDFQWPVLLDLFMSKAALNVNHVVKAATKTRKGSPAVKYAARERQPSTMERLIVTGALIVRLRFKVLCNIACSKDTEGWI